MKDPVIYACVPVAQADQDVLSIKISDIPDGYTKFKCQMCDIPVWMGPRQLRSYLDHPGKVLCFKCSLQQGAQPQNVQHLGGQSPKYEKQNKNAEQ